VIAIGTEVPELAAEHADGTIWADIEGDLWWGSPMLGWITSHWSPFAIVSQPADPSAVYGPYRAVLAPPREEYP
jgi:acyl-coenzyme A synthetase/AMP-(fatty) acid ligase